VAHVLVYPHISPDGSKLFAVTKGASPHLHLLQWSVEALKRNPKAAPTVSIPLTEISSLVSLVCSKTGETLSVLGKKLQQVRCTTIVGGEVCHLPDPDGTSEGLKYVVPLPHEEGVFVGLVHCLKRWEHKLYIWNLQDRDHSSYRAFHLPSDLELLRSRRFENLLSIHPSQQPGDKSIWMVLRTRCGGTTVCRYTGE
jgi:hypothetical protein